MHYLTIVTALSRPMNLPFLLSSVEMLLPDFSLRWAIIHSPSSGCSAGGMSSSRDWILEAVVKPNDPGGYTQKNIGIDLALRPGWIYFLDDDNLIHPDFPSALSAAIWSHPAARGFAFHQIRRNGQHYLRSSPSNCSRGRIDQGNFCFHTDAIGAIRHREMGRQLDGIFFEAVYATCKDQFVFLDCTATYYNALR